MQDPDQKRSAGPGIGRRGVLGCAGTLASGFLCGQAGASTLGMVQERDAPLPEFEFLGEDGGRRDQGWLQGRATVINFWATWCAPCVEEMPALDRLAAALEPSGGMVLALSQDRGGAPVVRRFFERTGVERLGVWLDPRGAAQRAFGARGLPTTVLVSRRGRITGWAEGALAWDAPDRIDEVRRRLG